MAERNPFSINVEEMQMPVRMVPLSREAIISLEEICTGVHLDGQCYEMALALHRGLDWPLVGLMRDKVIRHAAVRSPDGAYHDARGRVSQKELGSPFYMTPPYDLKELVESDLFAVRPIQERHIGLAARFAETLWPELPWKNGYTARAAAFLRDLEDLSQRHGLWVRAAFPGSQPQLADAHGDESGYSFSPTDDGSAFIFDRMIES